MSTSEIKWAFFGSSHFSVLVLDELKKLGTLPQLIVTTPDKPKGRGLKVQLGEVHEWAEKNSIPVIAPASLKNDEIVKELSNHSSGPWDTFLIASYGKIVPKAVLDIPRTGVLNIHPSLLPKFRGPSPLEGAILDPEQKETGVTIMKVDEQVDHGPIVTQKIVQGSDEPNLSEWPPYYSDLENTLAVEGARLFAEVLPDWVAGKISAKEQNHASAIFTKKFEKSELEINLNDDPEKNLRKIRAFSNNRGAYFFINQNGTQKRVIVSRAKITDGKLVLEKVKPEGKNEMNHEDFTRGLRN